MHRNIHFIPFFRCLLLLVLAGYSFSGNAQMTFSNTTPISIPDHHTAPIPGAPYPSVVQVSGLKGIISDLTITLHDYRHNNPDAVDMLLVAPDGSNAVILSDVGGAVDIHGIQVTLDDSAATYLPDHATYGSGVYKPTNMGFGPDSWPSAPVPSGKVALSAFYGKNPNGAWQLYVVSDVDGNFGAIDGGWSMTIQTVNPAQPVDIDDFEGRYDRQAGKNILTWTTAYEYNTAGFVVERATSGSGWTALDTLPAAGFSTSPRQYAYHDGQIGNGNYLYRLKLLLTDGTFKYSNVISIQVSSGMRFSAYPNAARDHIYLQPEDEEMQPTEVVLADMANNPLQRIRASAGKSVPVRMNLNLRPGRYTVIMLRGGEKSSLIITVRN